MKHMIVAWALAAAVLFLVGCGKAHAPTATESPAETGWVEYKTQDGTFTASFPAKPKVQFNETGEGKQILAAHETKDATTYAVVLNQVNERPPDAGSVASSLKQILDQAAASYGTNGKLEDVKKGFKVNGNQAVEYTVHFESKGKQMSLRSRVFFAHNGHQLFHLMAGGPSGIGEAQKFFESLKIGTYSEGKEQPVKGEKPEKSDSPSKKAEH